MDGAGRAVEGTPQESVGVGGQADGFGVIAPQKRLVAVRDADFLIECLSRGSLAGDMWLSEWELGTQCSRKPASTVE
jgi:hypothetical protein